MTPCRPHSKQQCYSKQQRKQGEQSSAPLEILESTRDAAACSASAVFSNLLNALSFTTCSAQGGICTAAVVERPWLVAYLHPAAAHQHLAAPAADICSASLTSTLAVYSQHSLPQRTTGRCKVRTFAAFSGVSKSDHTSCVSASLSLPSFSTLNRQKPADDSKSSSILRHGEWAAAAASRLGGSGGGGPGCGWEALHVCKARRCCSGIHPAGRSSAGSAAAGHADGLQEPCIPPAPGLGIPQRASRCSPSCACLQRRQPPRAAAPGVLLGGVASSTADLKCCFPGSL